MLQSYLLELADLLRQKSLVLHILEARLVKLIEFLLVQFGSVLKIGLDCIASTLTFQR